MKKIDFSKKLPRLRERRENKDRKSLRRKKFIAHVVGKILETKNPKLTNKAINEIASSVYGKNDKITVCRIKSMLKMDVIKTDIESELQRILTEREIKPVEKAVFHLEEGSKVAKSTKDHAQMSRLFLSFAEIQPKTKVKEERTFNNFADFRDGKPSQVKQTVERELDNKAESEQKNEESAKTDENQTE